MPMRTSQRAVLAIRQMLEIYRDFLQTMKGLYDKHDQILARRAKQRDAEEIERLRNDILSKP